MAPLLLVAPQAILESVSQKKKKKIAILESLCKQNNHQDSILNL